MKLFNALNSFLFNNSYRRQDSYGSPAASPSSGYSSPSGGGFSSGASSSYGSPSSGGGGSQVFGLMVLIS